MSLQEISRDIQLKAQTQKHNIEKDANDRMDALESEFKERFEDFKSDLLKKDEADSMLLETKLSSKYNKLSKEKILDAKNEIYKKVFDEALNEILSLSKSDKEKIFKKLITMSKSVIDFGMVYTSKEDLKFVKTLVPSKTEVKSMDGLTGLIIETKDGLERVDLSFKSLFENLVLENEGKLQKILF